MTNIIPDWKVEILRDEYQFVAEDSSKRVTNKSVVKRKDELGSGLEKSDNPPNQDVSRLKGVYPFKTDQLKPKKTTTTVTTTPTTTNLMQPTIAIATDEGTKTVPIDNNLRFGEPPVTKSVVLEGHIFFEYGLPATSMAVRLYSKGLGGTETMLGESKTDNEGHYNISCKPSDKPANFDIRIVDSQGKEIRLSDKEFRIDNPEPTTLVAPANALPLAPEYQRLASSIKIELGDDIKRLADLTEEGDRSDLSLLNQATAWDARLIALSSTAAKLSVVTGISTEALYGLFRLGLPTDKQILANLDIETVGEALNKAKDAGIISSDFSVEETKKAFGTFARAALRESTAPGTLSNLGQLLEKSGLSKDSPNNDPLKSESGKFEEIFFSHQGNTEQLWQLAQQQGISPQKIQGLRLQGKLAYLTLNNVAFIEKLQQEITSLDNLSKLVDLDLYKPDGWKARLNSVANNNEAKLTEIIPPLYNNPRISDRLDSYCVDLGRKVRLSFPTLVIAQRIKNEELKLGEGHDKAAVVEFLRKADAIGFRLGHTSVHAFIENNKKDLFTSDTPEQKIKETEESIKKIHRLYQITPSDESLGVLLDGGKFKFNSANEITEFSKDDFIDRFARSFPSVDEAELVYRKAQQVSAVAHSIAAIAKTMINAPAMYATSPSARVRQETKEELIRHFPTMELLFGSLDFCDCEDCNSVLSPAAYLVDLLKFLEPSDNNWKAFLDKWSDTHNADLYQKKWTYNTNGEEYPGQWKKPYNALILRRPDLPQLQLTCENTNTILPYIDIVNEVLEYYVASNNSLDNYQGHDTYNVDAAELISEPQYIIPDAYKKIRNSVYPLSLPFDLWIETVRLFFNYFDLPLWKVLDIFRLKNEVFYSPHRPVIENPTNITNSTLILSDADAANFKAEDLVTYYDLSANELCAERKTISSIGTAGSAGTGKTLLTISGEWVTPPITNDFLILVNQDYGWADIFAEYLSLSPAEYSILTDQKQHTKWWELYGYATESEGTQLAFDDQKQRIDLNSAKALSRRLGVSYNELVDLMLTGFVNPTLDSLVVMKKLGLDINEIFRYKKHPKYPEFSQEEQAAFEKRLDNLAKKFDPSKFDPRKWLDTEWQNQSFNKVIVLADPDTGCNFDQTILQYADGSHVDKIVFLKINLFVRIWKKLGWTIEEIDHSLQVFLPEFSNATDQNIGIALKTALVYIAHLQTLNERIDLGGNSILRLLTIWSNLTTRGKNALYYQLFLNGSLSKIDPIFDDPLGNYLSQKGAFIKDHLAAIQAALNLTTNELEEILEDVNINNTLDNVPLTLETISLLYRYRLLANGMKISVHDLISLKVLSGLVPFKPIEPTQIDSLDQDYPFQQTLKFVKMVQKIKASSFLPEDLNFLLRHKLDDPLGKYRTKSESMLALMQALGEGVSRIRSENSITTNNAIREKLLSKMLTSSSSIDKVINAVRELASEGSVDDARLRDRLSTELTSLTAVPDDLFETAKALVSQLHSEYVAYTDDVIRQKLSLVLPADAIERFFGIWKGTIEFSAYKEYSEAEVEAKKVLDPDIYHGEGIRVSYDTIRMRQYSFHAGVLSDEKKNHIIDNLKPKEGASQEQRDAFGIFSGLLDSIASDSQAQAKTFLDKYFFDGLLTYESLLGSTSSSFLEDATRHIILEGIMPFIEQRLINQFVVQTISADQGIKSDLVQMLLQEVRLPAYNTGEPDSSMLEVFLSAGQTGVDVDFFDGDGSQIGKRKNVETTDTAIKENNVPIKPTMANSASFIGYVVFPVGGSYRFFLKLGKKDAEAEFVLDTFTEPLYHKASTDGEVIKKTGEMNSGVPYRFLLNAINLKSGDISLQVQSENIPLDSLSQLTLYPVTLVEKFNRAYILMIKIIQLIQGLGLSPRETAYFLSHPADFNNIDLGRLPTKDDDSLAENPVTIFEKFLLLVDYSRFKQQLSAGTDDLIVIIENAEKMYPGIKNLEDAKALHLKPLGQLLRRDSKDIEAAAQKLKFDISAKPNERGSLVDIHSITKIDNLWRLWDALQVTETLGLPIEKIVGWLTTISDPSIARDVRNTVNAHYDSENWQRIAKSIFDKLRQQKRDALVAYIIHKGGPDANGFGSVEQLFEYFLIDPGMEPIVQTSRLRLAISSVQLFIQRCLLNLEERVNPSVIDSEHWKWMKNYRIWEASRKIFLFPENWLEPEFRDDKTHLFQEFESSLLQGDVSSDLVEDAFFNYLKKLQDLARLDVVTMYLEERQDAASNILHVLGRTFSVPHKYFYRRYAHQMWTPWEPVAAEIEGDHIVTVVWRERLYLFWVTFLEKAKNDPTPNKNFTNLASATISADVNKEVEIQLYWSEYYQGKWTTKESGGFGDPIRTDISKDFNSNQIFIFPSQGEDDTLFINLRGLNQAFCITSKNAPPKLDTIPYGLSDSPYSIALSPSQPTRYVGSGPLNVTLMERIETEDASISSDNKMSAEGIIEGLGDEKFSLLLCTRPSTEFDNLKAFSRALGGIFGEILLGNPGFGGFLNVIKKCDSFIESLPFLISAQPADFTTLISDNWKEIETGLRAAARAIFGVLLYRPPTYVVFSTIVFSIISLMDALIKKLSDPGSAAALADKARTETKKLTDPFFFQDHLNSFFVEPTLTEPTIKEWNQWIIPSPYFPPSKFGVIGGKLDFEKIPIMASVPLSKTSKSDPATATTLSGTFRQKDWVTNPATILRFGNGFIGHTGGLDLKAVPAGTNSMDSRLQVKVNPGSEIPAGHLIYSPNNIKSDPFLHPSLPESSLNIIGARGINPLLLRSSIKNLGSI